MKKLFLIMISIMMIASMWMPISAEETDISANTQTQESEESSSQTTNENEEIATDQDSKTDEDVISEETDSDPDVTGETEEDNAVEDEAKEETEVEQKPHEEVIDDSDKDISLFNDEPYPSEDAYHVYNQETFIEALNAIEENTDISKIVLKNTIVFNKPIVIDNLDLTIDFKGNILTTSSDFSCGEGDKDTCSFIDIKNGSSITFINKSPIRNDDKQYDVISGIVASDIDCLDSIIAIDGSNLHIKGFFNIESPYMKPGPKDSTVLLIKGSEVYFSGVEDDYGEVKGKVVLSNSSNATSAILMDGDSKLIFDQIYVSQQDNTMGASDLKPFILIDEIDNSSKDIIDVSKAQLNIEGSFVESANSDSSIDINALIKTGSSSETNVLKSSDGMISIVGYDSCVYGDCRSIKNRLTGGGETLYLPDDPETGELIKKLAEKGKATIDLNANYIIDYEKNGFIVVNGNKTLDTNAYNVSSTLTKMPNDSDLAFIVVNPGASLNIESGQAVADGRIILKSNGQSSNRSYTILNLGTLTINGVDVSNFSDSANAFVIQNGIEDTMTVNDVTYSLDSPLDSPSVSFNLKRGSVVGNIENIDAQLYLTGGTISDENLVDDFKSSEGILLKKKRITDKDETTTYTMINRVNGNDPLFDWLDNQFLHTFGTYGSLHSDARMTTITFLSISDSYVDNNDNYSWSIPEEDRFYGLTFVNEVEDVKITIGNLKLDHGERVVFKKTSEEYDIGNGGDDILGCDDGEDGIYIDNTGKTIDFGEDYSVASDLNTRYNIQFGIKIDDSLKDGQKIEIDTVFKTLKGKYLNIKLYLERINDKNPYLHSVHRFY